MKYSLRAKIKVDRVFFGGLCLILNLAARTIAFFYKRDHTSTVTNVKMIAISKYLGLGSIVRSTSIIPNLKKAFPNARIIYVTTEHNRQLFKMIPEIDDVLTIDDRGAFSMIVSTVFLVLRLIKLRIDLYFDLEVYSRYSTAISVMSLGRNRYGFFRETTKFRRGINTHLLYFNIFRNITDIYLQMAKQATGEIYTRHMLALRIGQNAVAEVDKLICTLNIPYDDKSLFLGINPNASDLCLERMYPSDSFVKIIEHLSNNDQRKFYIFLIGSPAEYSYIEESIMEKLSQQTRTRTFNFAGKLSLQGLVALLKRFALFLTNDSGPMHFAFNLGVPTISLWGPADYNHYRHHDNRKSVAIYQDIYCSPCVHQTDIPVCQGNNICMKSIPPEKILNEIFHLLKIRDDNLRIKEVTAQFDYLEGSVVLRNPKKKNEHV